MSEQRFEKLEAQLRRDEGEVLHAYKDDRGFLTIGVGICIDKAAGCGITGDESTYLLRGRISRAAAELDQAAPWWRDLSAPRQGVLLNMAFNLGIVKLIAFKKFLAAVRAGDWQSAGVEMEDSDWWGQVGNRARRLCTQLLEDRWV